MPADYIGLAVVAVVLIGGGFFLLSQAKRYRARQRCGIKPKTLSD